MLFRSQMRLIKAAVRPAHPAQGCLPALKANAMYEGTYPLVSALSRPVIAKHLVKVAREFGATTVAHGCTGKGNDQVRFEVAITSMAPDMDCIFIKSIQRASRPGLRKYAGSDELPRVLNGLGKIGRAHV